MKLKSEILYTFLPVGYDYLSWELGERPIFISEEDCKVYVKGQNLPYACHIIKIAISESSRVIAQKG